MDYTKFTCEEMIHDFKVKSVLLGLHFPETATEFQKAALFLAHLMVIVRDSILKGVDVMPDIIDDVQAAQLCMCQNKDNQR